MASPCIDVCKFDDETGWCLGCGMRRKDKKLWKKDRDTRPDIRAALPARLSALAASGNRVGTDAKGRKHD
ncbi:DUF1289 domain-containing protein [Plastoroseomonas arctica]|uniref:DUF1289 domain-containing protein n=1 Tax=Plastoroseomonas arctica TaxID=1509237 RepID=A0AAF1KMG3_9PROT|nr:DUF1289 domain-containing protein [Plastoroseomonas arctica]MBR0653473.1 DUF1289 domain-containing protein [Plastoroseomonas arctica]